MYPQIEFFPITITSTDLNAIWGCQSSKVSKILQTMMDAYPDEFFWRPLRNGRQGRKPTLFEIQIVPSLVEKLLKEDKQRETPAENITTLVASSLA
jgi:hypothetical protein